MIPAQKCMNLGCRDEGVALVRNAVLLCARHALKWVMVENEMAVAA